jgi:hypothetical protein
VKVYADIDPVMKNGRNLVHLKKNFRPLRSIQGLWNGLEMGKEKDLISGG